MTDSRFRLLVIDDDNLVLQSIRMVLPETWSMTGVNSAEEIADFNYDAVFVDMHLTNNLKKFEGLELIKTVLQFGPTEVIAMSGDLNPKIMEKCLVAGASRFLPKPLSPEEFLLTLEKIEALILLRQACLRHEDRKIRWIGSSDESSKIKRQIAFLKGENGPLLIEGASGTGKEVVANLIHHQEGSERPFISVNVAALPDNLFESELFGHVKGAFTGADQNKMGLAEAAHGGDLFLDEIEALPESQQAKLLRFLETKEVRRVGSQKSIHVNVRIIAATNRSLEQMVADGQFREDLLWRLNGKKILLPKLQERRDDVTDLANHFIDLEKPRHNKKLSEEALEVLKNYAWPGNVRELRRICEQICLSSPLPIVRAIDVQNLLPDSGFSNETPIGDSGLADLMNFYEAQVIRQALESEAEIDATAKLLKISRSSLYKKIKDHQIEM